MNNNRTLFFIINLIALFAIEVICFLFAKEFNVLFWTSSVLTIIAYMTQIIVNVQMFNKDLKRYVFGLPVTYMASIYVVLQSVACIVLSLFSNIDFKIGFTIQFLICAIFMILIFSAIIGKNSVLEKDERIANKKSRMIFLASQISAIESNANDRETKIKVHKLYELAKMSNPKFDIQLNDIEYQIEQKIYQLKEIVNNKEIAENLIDDIKNLINERNSICKGL